MTETMQGPLSKQAWHDKDPLGWNVQKLYGLQNKLRYWQNKTTLPEISSGMQNNRKNKQ